MRRLTVLGALIPALVLAGCSSSGPKHDAAPSGPGGTVLSQYPLPAASAIKHDAAKIKQTAIDDCAALPGGGWRAMGTVKNDGSRTQSYAIVVYFVNQQVPVDFARTSVDVPARKSVTWVAEKRFGSKDKLSCQLAGVG